VLPCACGHKYHRTCIAVWLGRKNSCPLCCTQVNDNWRRNWNKKRERERIMFYCSDIFIYIICGCLYSFYYFTTSDIYSHCATSSWSSHQTMQRRMSIPQLEKNPCLRRDEADDSNIHTHARTHIHTHTHTNDADVQRQSTPRDSLAITPT
jgi:hypothetical protein